MSPFDVEPHASGVLADPAPRRCRRAAAARAEGRDPRGVRATTDERRAAMRTVLALAGNDEEPWTLREIAAFVGYSVGWVHRVLQEHAPAT